MLGKKILTRLTRLGLAIYAMTWCLSFTVCAEENPLGDSLVRNYSEISYSEEEFAADPDDGEKTQEIAAFEEEDAAFPEERVGTALSGAPDEDPAEPELNGEDVTYPANSIILNGTALEENAMIETWLPLNRISEIVDTDPDNWTPLFYPMEFTNSDGEIRHDLTEEGLYGKVFGIVEHGVEYYYDPSPVYGGLTSIWTPLISTSFIATGLGFCDTFGDAVFPCSLGQDHYTFSFDPRNITMPIVLQTAVIYTYDTGKTKNVTFRFVVYDGVEVSISPEDDIYEITNVTGTNQFSVGVNTTVLGWCGEEDESSGFEMELANMSIDVAPEEITWTLYDENNLTIPSSSDICYVADEVDSGEAPRLNISFPGVTERSTFRLEANYTVYYKDIEGNQVEDPYSASREIVVDPDGAEDVQVFKIVPLDGKNETSITNTTETRYFNVSFKNLTTGDFAEIDPGLLKWKLLDENDTLVTDLEDIVCPALEEWTHTSTVLNISFPGVTKQRNFTLYAFLNNSYIDPETNRLILDTYEATWPLNVNPYSYNVSELSVNNYDFPVTAGSNLTFRLQSADPEGALLDPSRIRWHLGHPTDAVCYVNLMNGDELGGVKITYNGTVANIDTGGAEWPINLSVYAKYYNDADPAEYERYVKENIGNEDIDLFTLIEQEPDYVYIQSNLNVEVYQLPQEKEAHLPETTATVQIYKKENLIPVSLRYANKSYNDEVLEYEFLQAGFMNENLTKYFDISVAEDGVSLNVTAKSDLYENTTLVSELMKKKQMKTGVWVVVKGKEKIYDTKETLTVKFGNAGPSVKAKGKLIFNSYNAGDEAQEILFTGADIVGINASGKLPKGILVDNETDAVRTTSELPAKVKKGKFNVLAYVEDDNWNLPEDYAVKVPVNYVVKNDAPKLVLKEKSIVLNNMTEDQYVTTPVIKNANNNTEIHYSIQNAKKKTLNTSVLQMIMTEPAKGEDGEYRLQIFIAPSENTQPGMTYRVNFFAENNVTKRQGSPVTLLVKTPSKKDAAKTGLSFKAKGSIDASNPDSLLVLTISGKNLNLYGRTPTPDYNITVEGAEGDVSDKLIDTIYDADSGKLYLGLSGDLADAYNLTENFGGKKLTVNVAYYVGEDEDNNNIYVNGSYTTKIAQSKVQPKLEMTKLTVNPEFDNDTIVIPVTGVAPGYYLYNVSFDCGKGVTSPFTGKVEAVNEGENDREYLLFNATAPGLKALYGKTCTLSVKPIGFGYNLSSETPAVTGKLPSKAATCKITVLDPGKPKNKISASFSVTGKIDPIRDDTFVNGTLKLKNAYTPTLVDYDRIGPEIMNITTTVKKKQVDCTDLFYCEWEEDDGRLDLIIYRKGTGADLPAGTYKANMKITVLNATDGQKVIPATMTFKVERGKKNGLTIRPSDVKLVNRDFGRKVKLTLNVSDPEVNEVREVVLDKAYKNKFLLIEDTEEEGVYYLRMKPGYVEKLKKNPISKFKLYKKVAVKVYYEGSPAPDTVNLKLILNP